MKIILKHKYYGNIKKFENKNDLIREILEHKQSSGIPLLKNDTINDLIYKFFGDYRRI